MINLEEDEEEPKKKLRRLLKKAALKAVAEGDPWAKHEIEKVPAEKVIRHMYQPETETWKHDETIVKIQKDPFTHGAMRFCYRMKKRSPPPESASNHRFHDGGWTQASNYVAKAYLSSDEEVDTSDQAKTNVKNDIILQYEASHWSNRFNEQSPPKKIIFIRAYAIEFPDRNGKPWFAVERFIFGSDQYGAGFTKHNTNAGFVDADLHRITPQVFSAFSFYESEGNRLVADIQGVGNLFTDPQVLSSDYRFGDGDLGPRGMALFFNTFRHNTVASALGIPVFPLSRNELKHQSKYEDDIFSMSGDNSSYLDAIKGLNRFEILDLNRGRRKSSLMVPPKEITSDDMKETEKRSNQKNIKTREERKKSPSRSFKLAKQSVARTRTEMHEVKLCLDTAKEDFEFDMKTFFRKESGVLMAKVNNSNSRRNKRTSLMIRRVSDPMKIGDSTKLNIGRVHYQLAVLHGLGRFPETVPNNDSHDAPSHDVFSVLFHLCQAASLRCVPACLALGRTLAGLGTCVSPLLDTFVPVDFEAAKELLKRAVDSEYPPNLPKAAANCILYQIYIDENSIAREETNHGDENEHFTKEHTSVSDLVLINLLEDILDLISASEDERQTNKIYNERTATGQYTFQVGDKVEGNYSLEGNYYPGIIDSILENGDVLNVEYDDDGSVEYLSRDNVRMLIPPTATQHDLGGPLTDEEAGFGECTDEVIAMESYQLKADLAKLIAKSGDKVKSANLYEEAAHGAMEAGKMKTATQWSLIASGLLE
mmetsp:Transcript_17800/g.20547  ORF Transcript_17800/g.20547 Transcript_17800/m.20547 type:complete len:764 (-) Transcript_17800:425-2716(-)|eukprot:CAMPEP_0170952158 /NCGR_PEP_ID=MMETSP0735-20130129/31125_1 /TAXON_ID=186038 /ORGANISM="Fragilariopsis kerguelensis, Strain L26-C5" /LENGTH=763 /DNA_ID=CAMNT_0011363201 /DNA_START=60 /DNA_END=2351 /DNA_ORIENTATION=+